jgi:hypothetical protein
VLVVVDQFEELFRFRRMARSTPTRRAAFVKLLLQAAADPSGLVSVIITLRSDTLGACADFRDLPEAVSRGGYLVPRLKREQRKEAIVRPVALRGAQIAPRLVQRLLNDVSDDFDDLPVMQHALSRTWAQWAAGLRRQPADRPGRLRRHRRRRPGAEPPCRRGLGVAGAWNEEGGTVERVFRTLTERVAEGTEVRRPLQFSQLQAICGGGTADGTPRSAGWSSASAAPTPPSWCPGRNELTDDQVIDISHESLIRQWARCATGRSTRRRPRPCLTGW